MSDGVARIVRAHVHPFHACSLRSAASIDAVFGSMSGLHAFDRAARIEDEEREDVDSVGGLIAKILGRVPIPGSSIVIDGWKLTAERPVGRRHRIGTVLAVRSGAQEAQL